jgi:uncharacterized protein involved in exopolysaccharide biosynthesis
MIENYEEEISLVDILKFFIRHKVVIISSTLLFFIVSMGLNLTVFNKETSKNYLAESALIVLGTKSDINIDQKMGVLGVKELADVYPQRIEDRKKTIVELIKSPLIISSVIQKVKDSDFDKKAIINYSIEDFVSPKSKIIEVKQVGEIIKVTVRLNDKNLAKFFADEIVKHTVDFARRELYFDLPKEQQEKLVKVAYLSVLPEKPEDEKKKKIVVVAITLLGFFIGIFFGMMKDVYPKLKSEV